MSNLVMSCQNSTVKNDFAQSIINHQSGGPGIGPRICSRSSRVQILGHTCNIQLVASCQLGFLILLCYVVFELFVSKYLRGVSVNQLDELSALSIISKPLIRTFLQRLQCSTSEKRALILTRFRDIVPTIKFKKKERSKEISFVNRNYMKWVWTKSKVHCGLHHFSGMASF